MNDDTRQTRAVVPGGPLQEAVRVKVNSESGEGILVKLDDGTEIRLKPSVMEVWRFINSYDANGYPLYQVQAGMLITTTKYDEKLRKA